LGVRADRQLRSPIELDDCWLLLNARGRPGAQIFDRRGAAGQEDPSKGARSAHASRWSVPSPPSAGRLRAQRGLHLRRHAHRDQIILPYAVSDTFSNFATIKIADLMSAIAG